MLKELVSGYHPTSPSVIRREVDPQKLVIDEDHSDIKTEENASPLPAAKTDKKARVENILMSLTPVGGCKKRKLYQPMQHETPMKQQKREEEVVSHDDDSSSLNSAEELDLTLARDGPVNSEYSQAGRSRYSHARRSLELSDEGQGLERFASIIKSEISACIAPIVDATLQKYLVDLRRPVYENYEESLGRHSSPNHPTYNFPPYYSKYGLQYHPSTKPVHPMYPIPYSYRPQTNHLPMDMAPTRMSEQHEALSLVTTPKKRRTKVTDTRVTPRTLYRMDDVRYASPSRMCEDSPGKMYYSPSHLLRSTGVAVPNPGLQQSDPISAYHYHNEREDSPLDGHMTGTPHSTRRACSPDSMYSHMKGDSGLNSPSDQESGVNTSTTLTPMHLRKAKLMFFWTRYPSSSVLKSYFPDIRFNKHNTAQLVKWFSNFREFYYIQIEKQARQLIGEGVTREDSVTVSTDSDLYRTLITHYNRNNHIELPSSFRYVIEQTLKEFIKSIHDNKDQEHSWKKVIYKVIARLDENIPDFFRNQSFLDQLD